ncbi:hypothetical protein HMPREF9072_00889 [Capnocytophaga sp. oral taxon 324 str. F0483]|nr:hypothetical protein HMPREF9072_00889 [Capnocytophaga sp. oral taxon 324 str. F0483]
MNRPKGYFLYQTKKVPLQATLQRYKVFFDYNTIFRKINFS